MKNRLKLLLWPLSLLLITLITVSCLPSSKDMEEEEMAQIQTFLGQNPTLTFEQKESGLYYSEITPGSGLVPMEHDTVYLYYTGKFLSGTIFTSNVNNPAPDYLIFGETNILKGLGEGISFMKPGGKSIMLLPSKLAYGSGGAFGISAYTPLIYIVNIVKISPGPAE